VVTSGDKWKSVPSALRLRLEEWITTALSLPVERTTFSYDTERLVRGKPY